MPSRVRIIVRTRPTNVTTDDFRVVSNDTLRITRHVLTGAGGPHLASVIHDEGISTTTTASSSVSQETSTFHVDAVLHNASQEVTYQATTMDLVESTLRGLNCTLLCYGQSGSGKTYTLFGGEVYPTRGCVPRAIQAMFDTITTLTEREFKVTLTFVEIQGEQLFDLLRVGSTVTSVKSTGKNSNVNKASVFIDGGGNVVLRGVEKRVCNSEAEALTAVFEGLQRRQSSPNANNPHSSRSHALLTFYVVSKSLVDSDAVIHHSRCNFVDLAGSDRSLPLKDEAAQQENKIINRSLLMLEQVVFALSGSRSRHVPYRQSKLTMLLKDSIGGNCRTTFIANIWPEQRHMEATLGTLGLAKRMVRIESNPTSHVSLDPDAHIKMLQKQVTSLKSELRMQDQLAGREAISTAPLESDELQLARERVMAFVDGTTPQVRVESVRDMNACFLVFKTLLGERNARVKDLERQLTSTHRPDSGTSMRGLKGKSGVKFFDTTEQKDQTRILNSITDGTAGVGVGTTDKPNPGLRDMLLQQLRFSSTGQPTHISPRNKNADELAVSSVIPPASVEQVAPTAITTNKPMMMPSERDAMKVGPRPQIPLNTVKETEEIILPPVERNNAMSTTVKSLKRQEGGFRDKRVAFEAYKRTSAGVCQLETIKNAQKLVEEKNASILELQKRANDIKADMETNVTSGQAVARALAERAKTRGASAEAVGFSLLLSESTCSSNVQNAPSGDSAVVGPAEDFCNMANAEKKAFLNITNAAVTRALTERGILMKKLNRHYEAFMDNFQYWYQSHLQPVLSEQGEKATVPVADVDMISNVNSTLPHPPNSFRAVQQTEYDPRFMDSAERFEEMEMWRRVQKDPESMTFYAAQRSVRKG